MIVLEEAGVQDSAELARLHGACFAEAWSSEAFSRLLGQSGTVALFAGGVANRAGFVLARTAVDEAEILALGVLEAARRSGFGRALVGGVAGRVYGAGARRLFLEVEETNAPARALYAGLGFREVGSRPAYYRGGTARGIILRVELPLAALGIRPEPSKVD